MDNLKMDALCLVVMVSVPSRSGWACGLCPTRQVAELGTVQYSTYLVL
jgi:hypothetical protein